MKKHLRELHAMLCEVAEQQIGALAAWFFSFFVIALMVTVDQLAKAF